MMDNWKPMSIAPKDATKVLIAHRNTVGGRWGVDTALYASRKDMWVSPDGGYVYDAEYWQPLPAPPATTSTREGE